MEFLVAAYTEEVAAEIKDLLDSKGIPTYAVAERMGRVSGHVRCTRVFVCLNNQLQDARAVLKDPEHVVTDPVDAQEYYTWADAQPLSGRLVWGTALLVIGALIFVAVALYFSGALTKA